MALSFGREMNTRRPDEIATFDESDPGTLDQSAASRNQFTNKHPTRREDIWHVRPHSSPRARPSREQKYRMQVHDVEIAGHRIQPFFKIGGIVEPSEPPRSKIMHLHASKIDGPTVRDIAVSWAVDTGRKYMNLMSRHCKTLA
jgi:hypothetical protein